MNGRAGDAARVAHELDECVRIEGGRILAVLAAATGDLQLAEDATQDATIAALEVWERTGVPANPAGWLYVAARRKAIDIARREATRRPREHAADVLAEQLSVTAPPERGIRDDELRLIFTCCHPALDLESRVALALRTLCGLSTAEVARALLVSEHAMAKRLVRTKQKITVAGIPYRIPDTDELPARLSAVCAVVHLVYTTGHHGATGDEVVRADLCVEAIRLARLVVDLVPGEPTPEALLALLLLTDARRPARITADGALVPLPDQDRSQWDPATIAEGIERLNRSLTRTDGVADPYQLQAAIAACHSTAPTAEVTDWFEILRLYRILARLHANPVVELNLAIALGEVEGPSAALVHLDGIDAKNRSHLWHVARAEMLFRLDRLDEATAEFRTAYDGAPTEPERRHLSTRLAACGAPG